MGTDLESFSGLLVGQLRTWHLVYQAKQQLQTVKSAWFWTVIFLATWI